MSQHLKKMNKQITIHILSVSEGIVASSDCCEGVTILLDMNLCISVSN